MEYTTQLDAAKKKIITKEMKRVAEKENIDVEILREKIEKGYVVIPANKNHKSLDAHGVGEGLKTISTTSKRKWKKLEWQSTWTQKR